MSINDLFEHYKDQRLIEDIKEDQKKIIDALYKEIESLKNSKSEKIKTFYDKDEIIIPVQLLILHYMGVLESIDLPNTQKAILLSIIFKSDGAENIRKKLSNIGGKDSPLLRKENLELVCKIFKDVGAIDALRKAEKDLEKI